MIQPPPPPKKNDVRKLLKTLYFCCMVKINKKIHDDGSRKETDALCGQHANLIYLMLRVAEKSSSSTLGTISPGDDFSRGRFLQHFPEASSHWCDTSSRQPNQVYKARPMTT